MDSTNYDIQKVIVHPTVLLKVVDHHNRLGKNKQVAGILLGDWNSKGVINIRNSFAVPFDEDDYGEDHLSFDHEYLDKAYCKLKKIKSHRKIVGWYRTGHRLHQCDIALNDLVSDYSSLNPILVIIDAKLAKESGLATKAYYAVEVDKDDGLCTSKIFQHVDSEIGFEEEEEVDVEQLLRNIEPTKLVLSTQHITNHEHDSYEVHPNETSQKLSKQLNLDNLESKRFIPVPVIASFVILAFLAILAAISIDYMKTPQTPTNQTPEIIFNLEHIKKIKNLYPNLLTDKKMRIIMTRLAVMPKEVSILMLLGKTRDSHCKLDPTFCVGQAIANVTQLQFGYIDAANPSIQSNELSRELETSLDGDRYSVMIDNLEKLPGSKVMTLFQFIDKDCNHSKRGMLLFVVYVGNEPTIDYLELKEADIAERILMERWSEFIPKDSLTSVISRMSGSIVKIF